MNAVRIGAAVRRLGRLFAHDPLLMLELACWRVTLPALKRFVGVKTLARTMWSEPRPGASGDRVQETIEVVSTSGRLFLSSNCLERSLVWYRVLSRAGANPRLVMGARRDAERLAGHTWIEIGGHPFGEDDVDRYVSVIAFDGGCESKLRHDRIY